MAKIAMVLANDFEDSEFRKPYDKLKEAGHDMTIVGEKMGVKLESKSGGEEAMTEKAASEVSAAEFDALVIPGGYSPDKLRTVDSVVSFTREFDRLGKPIAAICHAGSLLIEADIVRGKTVTSWPSIRKDLENAGALWRDAEVVVDGNLITSRKPDDLDVFCATILDKVSEAIRARVP